MEKLKALFQKTWVQGLIVGVITLAWFGLIQSYPTLPDADPFYHARFTEMMANQGIIKTFPYLPLTSLTTDFIDQHFLYHVILIPFVKLAGPLWGIKAATAVLGTLFFVLLYLFLKKQRVKWAWFYPLLLLAVPGFIFRLMLPRAPVASLLFWLIGTWFLIKRKAIWLFIWSFLFVWLYGGWPLLPATAFIYMLTQAWEKGRWWTNLKTQGWWPLTLTSVLGSVAGLMINPYWPTNLKFYWTQTIEIAVLNRYPNIGVGTEWYATPVLQLLRNNSLFFVLLITAVIIFFLHQERQSKNNWFWLILTTIFALATAKSGRYIEYLVPIGVIFSALSISQGVDWVSFKNKLRSWKLFFQKQKYLAVFTVGYLIIGLPSLVWWNVQASLPTNYQYQFNLDYLQGAANWLNEHDSTKQVIFHSSWDEFPFLFYYYPDGRYLSGLDVRFLYQANPDRYQVWWDLLTGKITYQPGKVIKETFGSRYLLVAERYYKLKRYLRKDPSVIKRYEDNEATIYEITQ